MAFRDEVVSGTTLVRSAIASPNYVPGVRGWTINRDGTAEFNGVTVRGTLHIGANAPAASIYGLVVAGQPQMQFNSGVSGETAPAVIFTDINASAGQPTFSFESATTNNGQIQLFLGPASSGGFAQATFATNNDTAPGGASGIKAFLNANAEFQTRLKALNLVSTGFQALAVGDTNATHLRVSASEVGAYTAGTTPAPLSLDPGLGGVTAAALRPVANVPNNGGFNTASGAYVLLDTNSAVTGVYPASGAITVAFAAQLTAAAGSQAALAVEVRDTNAAGTLRAAASDFYALSSSSGATGGLLGRTIQVSGLPTSGAMWVGLKLRSAGGGNVTQQFGSLVVTPSP